ncbi:XkdX family protein [Bacillus haynesii]|uniref:XkdX family protein n=1 Tax=Bacillus TaxID=1386 RepID=UPI00119ECB78|nr:MULTISPECIES: XkdX family protein [Bacillus]MCA1183619.1 XkdX family protein [Bacillus licheniformis]MCM3209210.1 XkdX family protein [Bacillus licheniformis]MCM3284818.1 XkdX family protein [Bacillus licheniformis]MCY7743765.1 XkdX family protein [Bacillus licheniformis]MCY7780094.1 XkdX family protein [Bacillus haynesii]
MDLNFWVYALYYKWADVSMVKQAMQYNDITLEELRDGVEHGLVTPEQYEEITGDPYDPDSPPSEDENVTNSEQEA